MRYKKSILFIFFIPFINISAFTQILQFEKKIESPSNRITSLVETDDDALMILGELIDNDSIYVDSAYIHTYHSLLYKVTLEGDTLWTKVFENHVMDTEYLTEIIKTEDGDFLLMGCCRDSLCLIKIDSNGETVWSRSIDIPVHFLSVVKAIEISNNDILILCSCNRSRGGFYKDQTSLLIKINQSGDKLWEQTIPEMSARDMLIKEGNEILLLVNESKYLRLFPLDQPITYEPPSPTIILQSYDFDGNYINNLSYSFIKSTFHSSTINNQEELFISGPGVFENIFPGKYRMNSRGLLMKIDKHGNECWTRYNYDYSISSIWSLTNSNLLTVSWPYLKTINDNGDSVNGYRFNYELNYKQKHLVLLSGNYLYQAGILKYGDNLVLSKINLGLISDGDYKPPDTFTQSIEVYPNPASDYLTIYFSWIRQSDLLINFYSDDFRVFVYDANGRQIKEAVLSFVNNNLIVTVNDLADGLYYFNVHLSNGESITNKVVVAH